MATTLTLREANRTFARRVREVEAGEEFVITRSGTPVARLLPVQGARVMTPTQRAAWECIKVAMNAGYTSDPAVANEPCDRDALYER